jgi:hypothetical protein
MGSGSERRTDKRKSEQLALVFHYAQETCSIATRDVSCSGALVRSPVSFPSGTLIILECPNLCSEGDPAIRLLARVVRSTRGVADKPTFTGLGLHWVRAYAHTEEALRDFLLDKLEFDESEIGPITRAPSGDAVFDFPTILPDASPCPPVRPSDGIEQYRDARDKLLSMQKGRLRLESPVVYSVQNMHYRGTLISLGQDGIVVAAQGALPFLHGKVIVRYPLDSAPTAPRVILFCETEMVLEPFGQEPGMFAASILGMDEMDSPGIFRIHLRRLGSRLPRW